jgi:hypothetical protein
MHPIVLSPNNCAHLALATGQGNVDETAGVFEALQSAALGDLRLLLGLNLRVANAWLAYFVLLRRSRSRR